MDGNKICTSDTILIGSFFETNGANPSETILEDTQTTIVVKASIASNVATYTGTFAAHIPVYNSNMMTKWYNFELKV